MPLQVHRRRRVFQNSGAPFLSSVTGSFVAVPSTVPTCQTSPYNLALVGTGTNWTSGTVFTVTGSGTSKVGQVFHSATSATLLVKTGATTGTATVGDGSRTTSITISSNVRKHLKWFPGLNRRRMR